jgi:outer membrane protein assembly factor BamB
MMFIFTSGGVVECVDADAGKKLWEHTLSDGFYSSPVLVGNRIIAIDMKGVAHIIIPDKKQFIQERTCKVGEMVVATPVPGKNKLWLRGVNYLYCVGKRESAE